jgi:hypothetical protein
MGRKVLEGLRGVDYQVMYNLPSSLRLPPTVKDVLVPVL